MFIIKKVPLHDWWYSLNISMKRFRADYDAMSQALIPLVIVASLAFVLWNGISTFRRKQSPSIIIHTLVCFMAIGVTALPLCSLTRGLNQHTLWGMKQVFVPMYRNAQPYRLINGYGLFRRMTGVGPLNGVGWAGQPPSVVQRPEIILEGVFEGDDREQWTELSFRWKPGNEDAMPQQVAPHQPRYVRIHGALSCSMVFSTIFLGLLVYQVRLADVVCGAWDTAKKRLVFEYDCKVTR
jgi:hypothetical protein